jgi:hypothetical protein
MKFSELLGEPEPDPELPDSDSAPISVFAPVPVPPAASPAPPVPAAPASPSSPRSGLAELNVHHVAPEPPTIESSVQDQLVGLTEVVDDLLPSTRSRK